MDDLKMLRDAWAEPERPSRGAHSRARAALESAVYRVWPGVEGVDESGVEDAGGREWQRPACRYGRALWSVRCRW
jgi:hypothetical protein